ncbi:MAG TPA: NnrS family protein [Polyangiaceae bacterium]
MKSTTAGEHLSERTPFRLVALTREPVRGGPSRTALFAKGFRPFFLAAALFAAFGVPFWVATLVGSPPWRPPENPLGWHAHEMVFGFAGAVLAGFLLTAVGNWTSRPTLEGWGLGALVATWLGARVLPFVPAGSGVPAAVVDVAFWLALLAACARPIVAARNRRNYGFLALLSGFALAAAASHAHRLGAIAHDGFSVRSAGVDLVTVALVVMTGRVVPMFTRNATGATDIRESKFVDRTAAAATALLVVLDLASAPLLLSAIPAGIAGAFLLVRAAFFGPRHALGNPLLWVLHLGHLWVAVGLVLRGLVPLVPWLPSSIALHAVTAGGLGLLSFGMMTRVTLGHTGRMLAAPKSTAVAMLALSVAALLRVVGPLVAPEHVPLLFGSAAALWSVAFLTYVFAFGRALVTPRVDGRPG